VNEIEFHSSEGLRRLLFRLHYSGRDTWSHDPEAADLMTYCIDKYGSLARKHRLEPADAAAAAFEVMRSRAVRIAGDPWAVVTRAVVITLIAEERANGLLCSEPQARKREISVHHDAERFSDRETPICDYHPAFHVPPKQDAILEPPVDEDQEEPTNAFVALERAVTVFTKLGWPTNTAEAALDYIAARLMESGCRHSAHEMLRRDHQARALLDLSRAAWATMLRVVLGNPNADLKHTCEGRGMLMRLAIGEEIPDLFEDDALVYAIGTSAPPRARASHV